MRVDCTGSAVVSSVERSRRPRRVVDVEPDDVAVGVQVDIESVRDFLCPGARYVPEFDVEAVGVRVVVQLHG